MKLLSLVIALMLLAVAGTWADEPLPPKDSTGQSERPVVLDTALVQPGGELTAYAAVTNPENFEEHLHQNPTAALFKSMVLPGWGQLGNRAYIKAIVFAGLDAWLLSSAIRYGRDASDLKDQFDRETDPVLRNALYDRYRSKADSRNKYTWFAVIVTFISMFDAYVDAHLSGFPDRDRNEGVQLEIGPDHYDGIEARLSVGF